MANQKKTVSETRGCDGCPLQKLFPKNTFVAPLIRVGTKRLVMAEAPGEQESFEGEPLVGGSGSLFRGGRTRDPRTNEERRYGGIISQAGLRDEQLSYINTIQCRPPDNVYPLDSKARSYISHSDAVSAVAHCHSAHVAPVLRNYPWTRIDLLGDKALRSLFPDKVQGITAWRGSPLQYSIPSVDGSPSGRVVTAIPTIHPAALMRQQDLFPAVVNDLKKSTNIPPENYILHPTLEQVQAFTSTEFAFDIETNWPTSREITMVGLSDQPFHAIVVPFRGPYKRELERIFSNATLVIGHNSIQFDIPYLQEYGIKFNQETLNTNNWDTMLMQHLVHPVTGQHDLTYLASIFTSKPTWEFDKRSTGMELYNARDVDVTMQAYRQLRQLLKVEKLEHLYQHVQVPLARICKAMQERGIAIRPSEIEGVRKELETEMAALELKLPEKLRTQQVAIKKRVPAPPGTMGPEKLGKSGKPLKRKPIKFLYVDEFKEIVPWHSKDVIGAYLYEESGIPEERDIKTNRRTTGKMAAAKILRRLQSGAYKIPNAEEVHATLQAIQKLKQLNSLSSTFCTEDMLGVSSVHPHFNVHGTGSGRLSSSDPNLQNIPAAARYIYVPHHAGWKIIDVDYSGIENRLTALFANDTERLMRFDTIPDFSEHKWAVQAFFDIPYDQVVKDNDKDAPYGKAKRIVHGVNYGMGPRKISMLYDMPESEVRGLLLKWKEAIPKTMEWQARIGSQTTKDGFLTTIFGRKRWFWGTSMYTEGLSFLPQSSAADVIFRAMIGLMYERIGWTRELANQVVDLAIPLPHPANLLLQVHDSLVFECPAEMVDSCVRVIKDVMEQPFRELGGYRFPIGIAVGDSWGRVKSYKIGE